MMTQSMSQLLAENEVLRSRLEEAEEALRAIRAGEVDAVLVEHDREQVYTLESADKPYRLLVEQLPQGAATLTADGVILYSNGRFADLLKRSLTDLLGKPIGAFVSSESQSALETLLREGLASQVQGDVTLLRADGTSIPVYLGVNALQEGAFGLCLVVTDLTEQEARKRAEALEKKAAQQAAAARMLASIVASSDDAIISKTLDGMIQSWNAAAERLFGYTAEQAIGRHISLIIPDDRLSEENHIIACLKAGERLDHFETVRRRSDGRLLDLSLTISPIKDESGRVVGASKIARDITQRKRIEAALRESEARFRQLADSMPQIVWSARPDGDIDYFNERWYDFTGFPRGECGQATWKLILHPDDVSRCVETYFGCIRAEKPYQIEYRFKDRKTGGYRWFLGRAVPVRDEAGRVVRWFGTCTDIDDTKRLQEKLERADRNKDEFLAVLGHELRNPLAPIRNAAQVLKAKGSADPEVACSVDIMDRQLHVMSRLLEDLLDVSRVSRNDLVLRRACIDLAGVIEAAVEISRPVIETARHELTIALPLEPVYVNADSVRLAQVFSNLLTNAAKYTDEGGHIALSAERKGSEIVVSVKDDGIGIAPEMLPRVFTIFSQADRAVTRSQGGLGIGLALVKGVVELHGGRIEAYSEGPGRGSEFVVRLPMAVAHSHPMPPRQIAREVHEPAVSHRILVVDDNRDSADTLAMLLRLRGHEVRTAYDGEQAVESAGACRPDVVLLDIGMPKLDGYEACARIREQPEGKNIFLIALTGWGQDDDRLRTERAGFDHHILKPVDPAELVELLRSLPAASSIG